MKQIYIFKKHLVVLKSILRILLLVLFPVLMVQAQKIQPRLNYGALLEPQGKIINGGGQDLVSYTNYWNVMYQRPWFCIAKSI